MTFKCDTSRILHGNIQAHKRTVGLHENRTYAYFILNNAVANVSVAIAAMRIMTTFKLFREKKYKLIREYFYDLLNSNILYILFLFKNLSFSIFLYEPRNNTINMYENVCKN